VSDIDTIEDIYEAVGHEGRWRRLNDRLASAAPLSTEVAWHLAIGREAHDQQVRVSGEISTFMMVQDQLTIGALVVDTDGRIIHANAIASRHLAERAALTRVGEKVHAVAMDDGGVLSDAIKQASLATNAGRNPFLLLRRERRLPLCVVVVSTRPSDGAYENRRSVVLLLVDPELAAPPGTDVLRALFGFTAREAELAAILMTGCGLEEGARTLGVAMTTARTFLAHITAKTESHSQPELMHRLLSIPNVTQRR